MLLKQLHLMQGYVLALLCRFLIVISLCRSAAAFLRARNPSHVVSNSEFGEAAQLTKPASLMGTKDSTHQKRHQRLNFQFPFGDWSSHPWLKQHENQQNPRFTRDFSTCFHEFCVFFPCNEQI